ncbi:TetR/AcrR family transcriptional regulator [Micromonospora craniellae]|uniref:TetR/AcrR family transcriptional regulator n=1 Tax=Micromonospora craniellae TaxID=2294034 RepID=A0A372FWL4_9ACTN|nr:TetR/AcrR family transcriptional regulator [Micromonospora craniellae]QOC92629.1 TetR/AcrR family transcriptional regulator [Micromonospora craniellae]RFS45165.1 TetR/AcrR family transcriptional regulator [Micromonospora craniellae]
MTSGTDAPRPPGRPRSVRADEAIVEATLDLLAEGSTIETISVEAIAARAGVGKATIYRRWPGKNALLHDALRTLKGDPPQPAGRSVREDLITLVSAIGQHIDPRAAKIMPCLVPVVKRDPEQYALYQNIIGPRRAVMREVLRRGVHDGELRADLDIEVAMAMLTGPMLIQRVMNWNPDLDATTLPEKVVDQVLAGIAAR